MSIYLNLFVALINIITGSSIKSGINSKPLPNMTAFKVSISSEVSTPMSERALKNAIRGVAYLGHLYKKCSVVSLVSGQNSQNGSLIRWYVYLWKFKGLRPSLNLVIQQPFFPEQDLLYLFGLGLSTDMSRLNIAVVCAFLMGGDKIFHTLAVEGKKEFIVLFNL